MTEAIRIMKAAGEDATAVTVESIRPYTTLAREAFRWPLIGYIIYWQHNREHLQDVDKIRRTISKACDSRKCFRNEYEVLRSNA